MKPPGGHPIRWRHPPGDTSSVQLHGSITIFQLRRIWQENINSDNPFLFYLRRLCDQMKENYTSGRIHDASLKSRSAGFQENSPLLKLVLSVENRFGSDFFDLQDDLVLPGLMNHEFMECPCFPCQVLDTGKGTPYFFT